MPITRNSDQRRQTLEQFYFEISQEKNYSSKSAGKLMLDLLEMINHTFPDTQLWGLTSLYRLVIQAENASKSPWYIIVSGVGNEYHLEYLMPDHKSPWQGARVVGGATSLAEARRKLIIAMHECEGWSGNEELAELVRFLNEE
jgi:hypothetical protein